MLKDDIKKYRNINNLTQDELANKVFVSRTLVTKWETGSAIPTKDNIIKMAQIFNVPVRKLLSKKEYNQIILGTYKTKLIEKILILSSLISFIVSITLFIFSFILENNLSNLSNIKIFVPTTRITSIVLFVISIIILVIEMIIRHILNKRILNK